MTTDHPTDDIERTRARIRASRAEIFELAHELRGDVPLGGPRGGFPRSRLMRAAAGTNGKIIFGALALTLGLTRPKLLWRVVRLAPLLQPVALRYLAHRFMR
jgi:hypothetical protein